LLELFMNLILLAIAGIGHLVGAHLLVLGVSVLGAIFCFLGVIAGVIIRSTALTVFSLMLLATWLLIGLGVWNPGLLPIATALAVLSFVLLIFLWIAETVLGIFRRRCDVSDLDFA